MDVGEHRRTCCRYLRICRSYGSSRDDTRPRSLCRRCCETTAPFEEITEAVQGKIVVDTTVPLVPPKVSHVQLPEGGSVAKRTQENLGGNVRVVSAFQTVAAAHLAEDESVEGEVLVCGDNVEARTIVLALVETLGLKGWHGGPIDNSVVSESLTPLLIFLNKRYRLNGAGIRIVGH